MIVHSEIFSEVENIIKILKADKTHNFNVIIVQLSAIYNVLNMFQY